MTNIHSKSKLKLSVYHYFSIDTALYKMPKNFTNLFFNIITKEIKGIHLVLLYNYDKR